MIIKLILICLSNSFFNFLIKMKNEKRTVFRFPFFYENEKQMKVLIIQRKNLLDMKMVVSYLNFVFFIKVTANLSIEFWISFFNFGYTDSLGCVCKTNNHQWEICIFNQKLPYIPMEPYLQQYCQRHIQEYISWNRNQHNPGKSTTGMMLPSLLRVQDNNILSKWYEETTGLCFDCPADGDLHIPSQPTCSHFYLWV